MSKKTYTLTAESVRRGHPDKLCDQIADGVLDAYLKRDPDARVAVEVMATNGRITIAGEVSAGAELLEERVMCDTLERIGYRSADLSDDGELDVTIGIHAQSPDIAQAVARTEQGAGDQGIVTGYATDETPEYLPLPVVLAHRICRLLDEEPLSGAGVDGKAQVTVSYSDGNPVAVTAVVVSVQHAKDADPDALRRDVESRIIRRAIPANLLTKETRLLINPSGRFVKGGPAADTGLTGRKLAVDQYGPAAHIGGGALSGKDPTKTDRSGAYAARWVAKNLVAAGLAKRCEVQIAYAIGESRPISVTVDAMGTGLVPDAALERAVKEVFDLRPGAVIDALALRRPIYAPLAAYGHFGRPELNLPWERTDRRAALLASVMKQGYAL